MSDLDGITVVSVEQAVAAPYASGMLADAGARVIKIERPEGDFARQYDRDVLGQSAYFVWLNRGKESVCLDLKSSDDRSILSSLIATADVFIQNLKPGILQRIGFGSSDLRAAIPRLITCDISGFGNSGPYAGRKAYDLIVQAEAGICAITGTANNPARVGISICDIAAGAAAHAAILQALFARTRSFKGRGIEVSLFDSLAHWMSVPLLQHIYGGRDLAPTGVAHPTIAPYGAFACRGGKQIIFSVQNEREWLSFVEHLLGRAEFASDPRFSTNVARVSNRVELDCLIADRIASMTSPQVIEAMERAQIAYGFLNDLSDFATHPHLRLIGVTTPAGEVRIVAPPAITSDNAPAIRSIPRLGEHGVRIREDCHLRASEEWINDYSRRAE